MYDNSSSKRSIGQHVHHWRLDKIISDSDKGGNLFAVKTQWVAEHFSLLNWEYVCVPL